MGKILDFPLLWEYTYNVEVKMKCPICDNENMRYIKTSKIPGWAIALAIIGFPFGLLFLFARKEERILICDKCGYEKVD